MEYRAPVGEILFQLQSIVGYRQVAATERFHDASEDSCQAILGEAARLAEGVLAPLNREGDRHPAILENGVVRCSPGYREGYRAIADGGWVGIAAPAAHGGMGLPVTLQMAVGEMFSSACLALALNPLMSQGQIEALDRHADEEVKALFLPKLISGEWTGTMNLTESQAGSDVGALRCRAVPGDANRFLITGEKVFISWGDHDLTDNICHLVLARLPDALPGVRGISMFLVPKFVPETDGRPGVANRLRVVSLENKLGMHGSPTVVMAYERAEGWLIGEPGKGLAAMFTMMNNARLGVAVQGVGVAEAATQTAVTYALDRVQGRTELEDGTGTIIDHPDVRQMLLRMMALTAAARALALDTALSIDMARASGHAHWAAREAFLTPIAKGFCTDVGAEVADLGIQVHGGTGYVEESGAAQLWRDVRVTRIYEGTNGIQASDLVGRKLSDRGAAARRLLDEVRATLRLAEGSLDSAGASNGRAEAGLASDSVRGLASSLAAVAKTTNSFVRCQKTIDRQAGASAYLRSFGLLLGGHYLLRGALAAQSNARTRALAAFWCRRLLPEARAFAEAARPGSVDLYRLSASGFRE